MLLVMSTPPQPSPKKPRRKRLTPTENLAKIRKELRQARKDLRQALDEEWAWLALRDSLMQVLEATLRGETL